MDVLRQVYTLNVLCFYYFTLIEQRKLKLSVVVSTRHSIGVNIFQNLSSWYSHGMAAILR